MSRTGFRSPVVSGTLIGDLLTFAGVEWRVADYVLFEQSETGHVAVEPSRP